jgi:hypothetical protein
MSLLGVRVPRIQFGDNLVHIKAMRLANVQHSGPNDWRPNIVLSVPQIDLSARADRKMVNLYVYLRNFTKKSRFDRTNNTQIKNNKTVILVFPLCTMENQG